LLVWLLSPHLRVSCAADGMLPPPQVPSLMDGGALWFTDLTVADATYALPVLTSLTFLATVELGAADGMQGQSADMLKNLKNFMRGLAVVMVPFTASLPAVRLCCLCSQNDFVRLDSLPWL